MKKGSKYGESTKMVCFRVPESKVSEIKTLVRFRLNEYERLALNVDIDSYEKSTVGYRDFSSEFVKNDVSTIATRIGVGLHDITSEDEKKSTASGDDLKEQSPAISFERIASLPLGTELVEGFGSKGAIRKDENGNYYTKRTHEGKLEILKHGDYDCAVVYANENFK